MPNENLQSKDRDYKYTENSNYLLRQYLFLQNQLNKPLSSQEIITFLGALMRLAAYAAAPAVYANNATMPETATPRLNTTPHAHNISTTTTPATAPQQANFFISTPTNTPTYSPEMAPKTASMPKHAKNKKEIKENQKTNLIQTIDDFTAAIEKDDINAINSLYNNAPEKICTPYAFRDGKTDKTAKISWLHLAILKSKTLKTLDHLLNKFLPILEKNENEQFTLLLAFSITYATSENAEIVLNHYLALSTESFHPQLFTTAFYVACHTGNLNIVKLLIEKNLFKFGKNARTDKAYTSAEIANRENVMQYFKSLGYPIKSTSLQYPAIALNGNTSAPVLLNPYDKQAELFKPATPPETKDDCHHLSIVTARIQHEPNQADTQEQTIDCLRKMTEPDTKKLFQAVSDLRAAITKKPSIKKQQEILNAWPYPYRALLKNIVENLLNKNKELTEEEIMLFLESAPDIVPENGDDVISMDSYHRYPITLAPAEKIPDPTQQETFRLGHGPSGINPYSTNAAESNSNETPKHPHQCHTFISQPIFEKIPGEPGKLIFTCLYLLSDPDPSKIDQAASDLYDAIIKKDEPLQSRIVNLWPSRYRTFLWELANDKLNGKSHINENEKRKFLEYLSNEPKINDQKKIPMQNPHSQHKIAMQFEDESHDFRNENDLFTVIKSACKTGNLPFIKRLHEKRIFIFSEAEGFQYFKLALENKQRELVDYFIKLNLPIKIPLEIQNGREINHIQLYAQENNLNAVEEMLRIWPQGVNLQEPNTGKTALHYAVENLGENREKNKDAEMIINLLLEAGANPDITDQTGKKPYEYLDKYKFPGIYSVLNIQLKRSLLERLIGKTNPDVPPLPNPYRKNAGPFKPINALENPIEQCSRISSERKPRKYPRKYPSETTFIETEIVCLVKLTDDADMNRLDEAAAHLREATKSNDPVLQTQILNCWAYKTRQLLLELAKNDNPLNMAQRKLFLDKIPDFLPNNLDDSISKGPHLRYSIGSYPSDDNNKKQETQSTALTKERSKLRIPLFGDAIAAISDNYFNRILFAIFTILIPYIVYKKMAGKNTEEKKNSKARNEFFGYFFEKDSGETSLLTIMFTLSEPSKIFQNLEILVSSPSGCLLTPEDIVGIIIPSLEKILINKFSLASLKKDTTLVMEKNGSFFTSLSKQKIDSELEKIKLLLIKRQEEKEEELKYSAEKAEKEKKQEIEKQKNQINNGYAKLLKEKNLFQEKVTNKKPVGNTIITEKYENISSLITTDKKFIALTTLLSSTEKNEKNLKQAEQLLSKLKEDFNSLIPAFEEAIKKLEKAKKHGSVKSNLAPVTSTGKKTKLKKEKQKEKEKAIELQNPSVINEILPSEFEAALESETQIAINQYSTDEIEHEQEKEKIPEESFIPKGAKKIDLGEIKIITFGEINIPKDPSRQAPAITSPTDAFYKRNVFRLPDKNNLYIAIKSSYDNFCNILKDLEDFDLKNPYEKNILRHALLYNLSQYLHELTMLDAFVDPETFKHKTINSPEKILRNILLHSNNIDDNLLVSLAVDIVKKTPKEIGQFNYRNLGQKFDKLDLLNSDFYKGMKTKWQEERNTPIDINICIQKIIETMQMLHGLIKVVDDQKQYWGNLNRLHAIEMMIAIIGEYLRQIRGIPSHPIPVDWTPNKGWKELISAAEKIEIGEKNGHTIFLSELLNETIKFRTATHHILTIREENALYPDSHRLAKALEANLDKILALLEPAKTATHHTASSVNVRLTLTK